MVHKITVRELKERLNNYNDSDVVEIEVNFSDYGDAHIYIGDDLIFDANDFKA